MKMIKRPKQQWTARLRVEELGQRIVPAVTTTWTGAVSNYWDIAGNWDNGLPAAGDTAIIDSTSNDVVVRNVEQVGVLKITNQFAHTLKIDEALFIKVGSDGNTNDFANGTIKVDGTLGIEGGVFDWVKGNFTGSGSVFVKNNADFRAYDEAFRFDPHLKLQGSGIVRFMHDLDDPVQFKEDIYAQGNSTITLEGPYGPLNAPDNDQKIIMSDDSKIQRHDRGTEDVTVLPIYLTEDSILEIRDSELTVTSGVAAYNNSQIKLIGNVDLTVSASVYLEDDAKLLTSHNGMFDTPDFNIIGNLILKEQAILDTTGTPDGEFEISGDLTAEGGIIYLWIDAFEGINTISVAGDTTLDDCTLELEYNESPGILDEFQWLFCNGSLAEFNTTFTYPDQDLWAIDEDLILIYGGPDM